MAQEEEKSLLTNIDYQRLLMAQQVLMGKSEEPSRAMYNLINDLYNVKKALGLTFPEKFSPKLPTEGKDGEKTEQLFKQESANVGSAVQQKMQILYKVVSTRIAEVKEAIEKHGAQLEKTEHEKNVELLAHALQFNPLQKQLLTYYACSAKGHFDSILEAACPKEVTTQEDYVKGLAAVLDIKNTKQLAEELEPDSVLVGVNFLAHDPKTHSYSVDAPLQRILAGQYKTADDLLSSLLGPCPNTKLQIADYTYMKEDLSDMRRTLAGYLKDKNPKTHKNMVIGGPPGTGKTQLTAVLAKELGINAFLIGVAQKSQKTGYSLDEPTRDDRIKALVRAAFIVRQTGMKAILVFDEAEDVLRDLNRTGTKETGSKAFINELLENLGATTVFISNRTDLFDPATTRRILPYYGMNYMPFDARVGTIITKSKEYIGAELTKQDVKPLSELAGELSVAVIDSCIDVVGKRHPDKTNKKLVVEEIEREFKRALKAQNFGIPPAPIKPAFNPELFDPSLVSANADISGLYAAMNNLPHRSAGRDISILGLQGTGRRSIAQHLAVATGYEPRMVGLNLESLAKDPLNAHASDLEQSELDRKPLIFNGNATPFLANSKGHPFMDRVRAHPLPTFFIGDLPHDIRPEELNKNLSHLTFVMRTGYLSREQLQTACKKILGSDVTLNDVRNMNDITIESIVTVKNQLDAIGKEGDKAAALERMNTMAQRLKDHEVQSFGLAARVDAKRNGASVRSGRF